jgi:hypothetical protein
MYSCSRILSLTLSLLISLSGTAQTTRARSKPVSIDYSDKPVQDLIQEELQIPKIPLYHALIIGVSEYKNAGSQLPNLDRPVGDAENFYEILTTRYAFPKRTTTLLTNPTREDIINSLDSLAQNITERDNLLIFFAGHGYFDKTTDFGYWLASDAKSTSRASWIPNSIIKDYLKAIPAKHTLLISDACFGGSILKSRAISTMDSRKVFELYKDRSRKAITSGNLTLVPDESFFTSFLLKVLKENEQLILPASSLFARIYEPVLNNSPTVPQFGVVQQAGDEGGDFLFIQNPANK